MKNRIPTLDTFINENIISDVFNKFFKQKKTEVEHERKIMPELKDALEKDGWTDLGFDEEGQLIGNNKKYNATGDIVREVLKDNNKI